MKYYVSTRGICSVSLAMTRILRDRKSSGSNIISSTLEYARVRSSMLEHARVRSSTLE